MANLSIYSHLLKPHETLDLGGAIKDGMSMRQLSMQNTQAERTMDESEKKRKLMAAIPAMEHLSSMSPEERAAAYPRMQEQMIADGIMDRNQALPAHDEKSFQFKWAMMQKSPEYRAIQKDMLGNKLTESQIAKNYADAKKEKGNGLKEYFELGSGLRKEWTGLPTTKATQDVAASYNRVSGAAEDPSPAGDLALIFNYMKMLDSYRPLN